MTAQEFWALLGSAHVPVPAYELVFLILSLTICLLLKYTKVGLLIAYLVTFHMGYLFFEKELATTGLSGYIVVYFIFGILILFLAIISMLHGRDSS